MTGSRVGVGIGMLMTSLLGWAASPARAADVDVADVAVADVDRRYAFIDAELERSRGPAQAWWTVWTASYSAATLGGAGFALLATNHPLRCPLSSRSTSHASAALPRDHDDPLAETISGMSR
jgi:hypothetical protein